MEESERERDSDDAYLFFLRMRLFLGGNRGFFFIMFEVEVVFLFVSFMVEGSKDEEGKKKGVE